MCLGLSITEQKGSEENSVTEEGISISVYGFCWFCWAFFSTEQMVGVVRKYILREIMLFFLCDIKPVFQPV